MLENIKKEFSTRTLVLIPIAIVINIVIGELTVRLKLPIYLDSIGTVLVGAIAGPWAGALTGALADLIWGLFNRYAAAFFYVAAVIGVMAGLAGKSGAFQNVSPRWLSTIIGAVFFFSLTVFILAFINSTTDETGFTSFPSMADLLSSYAVVFVLRTPGGRGDRLLPDAGSRVCGAVGPRHRCDCSDHFSADGRLCLRRRNRVRHRSAGRGIPGQRRQYRGFSHGAGRRIGPVRQNALFHDSMAHPEVDACSLEDTLKLSEVHEYFQHVCSPRKRAT